VEVTLSGPRVPVLGALGWLYADGWAGMGAEEEEVEDEVEEVVDIEGDEEEEEGVDVVAGGDVHADIRSSIASMYDDDDDSDVQIDTKKKSIHNSKKTPVKRAFSNVDVDSSSDIEDISNTDTGNTTIHTRQSSSAKDTTVWGHNPIKRPKLASDARPKQTRITHFTKNVDTGNKYIHSAFHSPNLSTTKQKKLYEYKKRKYDAGWGGVDTVFDTDVVKAARKEKRRQGKKGQLDVYSDDSDDDEDEVEETFLTKAIRQGLVQAPNNDPKNKKSKKSVLLDSVELLDLVPPFAPLLPAGTLEGAKTALSSLTNRDTSTDTGGIHTDPSSSSSSSSSPPRRPPTLQLPSPAAYTVALGRTCAQRLMVFRSVLWLLPHTVHEAVEFIKSESGNGGVTLTTHDILSCSMIPSHIVSRFGQQLQRMDKEAQKHMLGRVNEKDELLMRGSIDGVDMSALFASVCQLGADL
jgi:hypothetical protein